MKSEEKKDDSSTKNVSSKNDSCSGHFRGANASKRSWDRNQSKYTFKRTFSNSNRSWNDGKRTKLDVGNRLKEPDIGVTEYVSTLPGFSGLIKERFSDFHVNEIDLDGQIAILTNQDIPKDPEPDENIEDLKASISETVWDQLQKLSLPDFKEEIEIDVTDMSKEQRRAVHTIAKKLANVVSQTIEREDKKLLNITKDKSSTNAHGFKRDFRVDWKLRGGDYCYFLLHKVNMDTMDVLNQIAGSLRIKPNYFTYAGTKDRRAWTTQWVCLRKIDPQNILRAARVVRGAYVGNFKYAKEALKLGMLKGNRFRIVVRNVTGTDEQIEQAMVTLRDKGFINYFGLQRFGTVAAIPTHEIGKALLQGKWQEAIDLILKPRDNEQDRDLAEARRVYATTKDARQAYQRMKRTDKIEAALLQGIFLSGSNDPQGALNSVPRNARLMYIHAYQSLVWNHMVSRRIKEFGTNPIVGDLVYKDTNGKEEADESEKTNNLIKKEDQAETQTETAQSTEKESGDASPMTSSIHNLSIDSDSTSNTEEQEELHNLPAVKILTEEDLPNYTLADVVMPQPGWKVTYPPYAKQWYNEFLAKDELTMDLRQKNKKYSLGGAYRKMLQTPSDLSWRIVRYDNNHDDLIISDIGKMRNKPLPEDSPDGKRKAVILEMSLNSASYATMALREILKCDTSAQAQAAQSAAYAEAERKEQLANAQTADTEADVKPCLETNNDDEK